MQVSLRVERDYSEAVHLFEYPQRLESSLQAIREGRRRRRRWNRLRPEQVQRPAAPDGRQQWNPDMLQAQSREIWMVYIVSKAHDRACTYLL